MLEVIMSRCRCTESFATVPSAGSNFAVPTAQKPLVPLYCGPGGSVGIATDYGLDGLGSNPGGDEIFPPVQTGPGAHPASCTMGTGSLPGVKCGQGVLLTTYPLLVPMSWKSRAIPVPTLWATFTFTSLLYTNI